MKFIKSIIPYLDQESFAKELINTSQLRKLFDLVRFDKVKSNLEAHAVLFGKNGSKAAYKQVRLRLRRKLIDFILREGAQIKNVDSYSQRYRVSMNAVAVAKYLMLNNAKQIAVEMEEILIETTRKYEYTDLTLSLCRDLCNYFSENNYQPKKIRKYRRIMSDMRTLYNAELELSQYYGELRAAFAGSRAILRNKLLSKAEEYAERANVYLNLPQRSYQLLVSIHQIYTIRYELTKDYVKLLEVCESAIIEFQNRKVYRKSILLYFNLYKVMCFIQLGRYLEVEQIAKHHFQVITQGSTNWFVLKAYLMISKLYSNEYQEAFEIQKDVGMSSAYQKQPATLLQTWTVYEAHIELLVAFGKIKTDQPSKFRLNKFLNDVPLYTKDKKGLNIAILIIQVLFLLQQRKYSQIIDRVDALKQYCYRYLKKDDTFRSHCFIRMLLQMPRADFNRIRTERYAEPFLTKLRSVPIAVSEQSIEVEVIPYEDLWKMTLELLD